MAVPGQELLETYARLLVHCLEAPEVWGFSVQIAWDDWNGGYDLLWENWKTVLYDLWHNYIFVYICSIYPRGCFTILSPNCKSLQQLRSGKIWENDHFDEVKPCKTGYNMLMIIFQLAPIVLLQADADLSPEVSSDLHEGLLQCLLQLSLEALWDFITATALE